MHNTSGRYLLMIEPTCPAAAAPDRDWATRKMTRLLQCARAINPTFGWHDCVCGVRSDNCEWLLPCGLITNNLAVHYLARHRDDIPRSEIEKLRAAIE